MQRRNVVLGVTGSIAAFKAAQLASELIKRGYGVDVIMTKNACEFIAPLTFETLTGRTVSVDMFARRSYEVEHIALAKKADIFVVAPATANFIGKYANGIADDMLTTTIMATKAPVLIAPAMNSGMYASFANAANMQKLSDNGVRFVQPETGRLACGDEGIGKLADVSVICEHIGGILQKNRDFAGKRVLVTAGPTREAIDPVRFISNRSSGKMGYAVAREARMRGAEVALVSGPVHIAPPLGVRVINVETTAQMYSACMSELENADVIIKAAAPSDFTPSEYIPFKIKKIGKTAQDISLLPTTDILKEIGEIKGDRFLCGFAAETNQVGQYAIDKLNRKHLDMIVANDVSKAGVGFDKDTNAVTIYTKDGRVEELPLAGKDVIAAQILDRIAAMLK